MVAPAAVAGSAETVMSAAREVTAAAIGGDGHGRPRRWRREEEMVAAGNGDGRARLA
jgi:hypothetical protein